MNAALGIVSSALNADSHRSDTTQSLEINLGPRVRSYERSVKIDTEDSDSSKRMSAATLDLALSRELSPITAVSDAPD